MTIKELSFCGFAPVGFCRKTVKMPGASCLLEQLCIDLSAAQEPVSPWRQLEEHSSTLLALLGLYHYTITWEEAEVYSAGVSSTSLPQASHRAVSRLY